MYPDTPVTPALRAFIDAMKGDGKDVASAAQVLAKEHG
jgi:hypothetical protein